jgi:ketosteroid isomerase-like protein
MSEHADAVVGVRATVGTEAALPAPVGTYFAALNEEDFPRLAAIWCPTSELRAVGTRDRHGPDEIMSYYHPLFEPWAEHRDRPTRVVVADSVAVVEVSFTGVTHAGTTIEFDAVDVFDLVDGQVERLTCWYDLAWLRKQL